MNPYIRHANANLMNYTRYVNFVRDIICEEILKCLFAYMCFSQFSCKLITASTNDVNGQSVWRELAGIE